jgi:predicted metal-dependent peptidase
VAKSGEKSKQQSRLEKTRARIWGARAWLRRSLLGPLLDAVRIEECEGKEGDPLIACVDAEQAAIWLNPHRRPELGEPEWTFILAHQLLHLGLNHAARRLHRDPLLWNAACDTVADHLLHSFKIGQPPRDFSLDPAFAGMREEEIYDLLAEPRGVRVALKTFAGAGRPDMVRMKPLPRVYSSTSPRRDYENLLAEGIRLAVDEAVEEAAETLGQAEERPSTWRPAELARRWVINEFPLLGALATQIRIIADAKLCERLDVSIAAVNGFLGEMYLHPGWKLTQDELVFIYVHELLHVALLHHTRCRGRDPWLWNVSCDFIINGWLVEMGVGRLPSIGALYDPRLQGMSAEEVYDLLASQPRRCRGLRGFRGELGDMLLDRAGRQIYRGDITTLDDVYRCCLSAGMSCVGMGRGTLPAGLLEEIRALFAPPVPWDVELGRWMEQHVPIVREKLRTYARASRRQASTPDIPRPARYVPQEWMDACTFGVVLDTSGSMDRELLGRALGAIASYAEAREVPAVRLVLCDAAPYDRGFVVPTDLRGIVSVKGRGGTVLQPGINHLVSRPDFPAAAPVMVITDGWCEEELVCAREHCFVLPRKGWKEGAMSLRTAAPVFRVLKEEVYELDAS